MLAVDFVFNQIRPGMPPEMVDGFIEAAAIWSSVLTDDVTVVIDIGAQNLGPGILGGAISARNNFDYSQVRNALVSDAQSPLDQSVVANLQTASSLGVFINRTSDNPTGFLNSTPYLDIDGGLNNRRMLLNTANAKALGLIDPNDPSPDGSIEFSTAFTWDFDRSDGITGGRFDFIGTALHEIGHVLGFVSGVDRLDGFVGQGIAAPDDSYQFITTLDLFRSSSDSREAGADLDWSADMRTKEFTVDGGQTMLGTFSTGPVFGDGNQASHWEDDLITLMASLGLMDPSGEPGIVDVLTATDIAAFDAIGWDTDIRPVKFTVTPSGGSTQVLETGPAQIGFELANTDRATVVLNQQPASNVVIQVRASDTTEATVSTQQLTFTPSNWNVPQVVTVTGVNDSVPDGNQESLIVFSVNRQLSDSVFDDAANVFLPVTTIDSSRLTIAETGPGTTVFESGQLTQDNILIALGEAPQTPVTLKIESLNPSKLTVSVSQVTFTASNWNLPKSVLVRSVDNQIHDGDQSVTVRVSVVDAVSDPLFRDVADATIQVTVRDNETSFGIGDANGDRVVNSADFNMLRSSFGTNNKSIDFNGDGQVNAADYTVWRDHYGVGTPPALPVTDQMIYFIAHDHGSDHCCCAACTGQQAQAAVAESSVAPLISGEGLDLAAARGFGAGTEGPAGSPAAIAPTPQSSATSRGQLLLLLAGQSHPQDAADEAFAEFSDASEEEDSVDALFAEDELDAALVLL